MNSRSCRRKNILGDQRLSVHFFLLLYLPTPFSLSSISYLYLQDDKRKSVKIKDSSSTLERDTREPKESKEESKRLEKEQKKREKEQKKKEKEEKKREKEDKKNRKSGSLTASRLQLHVAESDSPRLHKEGQMDSGSEVTDASSHIAKSEADSDEESNAGEAPGILLSPQERQMLYETIGFDQALSDVLDEKLPPEVRYTRGRNDSSLIFFKPPSCSTSKRKCILKLVASHFP